MAPITESRGPGAGDMFLKVKGAKHGDINGDVDGEATHKDHKGEIEVLSWSWGVTNNSATAGGGSGKGKGDPGLFSFTHVYDKASPVLAKKCTQGVHFPTVTMTCR